MDNKKSTNTNNLILFERVFTCFEPIIKQPLMTFKQDLIVVIAVYADVGVMINDKFYLLKKDTVNVFICNKIRIFSLNSEKNTTVFAVKNNGLVLTDFNFTKPLNNELKNLIFSLQKEELAKKFAIDFYKFLVDNRESEKTANSPEFISELIKYLTENYSFPISVLSCAKAVNVTPNYLEYAFKKHVGVPIASFLAEIRLVASENLLVTTSLSLNEISKSVGLNDAQVLIRLYKKYYGVTPYKYKLRLRKNENGKK